MYYINTPLNVHVVMNIFKTFMSEKLRRRVSSLLSLSLLISVLLLLIGIVSMTLVTSSSWEWTQGFKNDRSSSQFT